MTTIEVNILADEDQDFVMSILNALAQKHIIEIDPTNSFPAEGPKLTDDELIGRINQSGANAIRLRKPKQNSVYEDKRLGISFY